VAEVSGGDSYFRLQNRDRCGVGDGLNLFVGVDGLGVDAELQEGVAQRVEERGAAFPQSLSTGEAGASLMRLLKTQVADRDEQVGTAAPRVERRGRAQGSKRRARIVHLRQFRGAELELSLEVVGLLRRFALSEPVIPADLFLKRGVGGLDIAEVVHDERC
jgi:hypothetical protein